MTDSHAILCALPWRAWLHLQPLVLWPRREQAEDSNSWLTFSSLEWKTLPPGPKDLAGPPADPTAVPVWLCRRHWVLSLQPLSFEDLDGGEGWERTADATILDQLCTQQFLMITSFLAACGVPACFATSLLLSDTRIAPLQTVAEWLRTPFPDPLWGYIFATVSQDGPQTPTPKIWSPWDTQNPTATRSFCSEPYKYGNSVFGTPVFEQKEPVAVVLKVRPTRNFSFEESIEQPSFKKRQLMKMGNDIKLMEVGHSLIHLQDLSSLLHWILRNRAGQGLPSSELLCRSNERSPAQGSELLGASNITAVRGSHKLTVSLDSPNSGPSCRLMEPPIPRNSLDSQGFHDPILPVHFPCPSPVQEKGS